MSNKEFKIFRQAEQFYFKGESEQAIDKYNDVLKLNPKNYVAYVRIADIHAKVQNYKDALLQLEKAKSLCPTVYAVNLEFGQVYSMSGNLEDAKKYYHRAVMINPKRTEAIEMLAPVCAESRDHVLIKNTLEFAIDHHSSNVNITFMYGATMMLNFINDNIEAKKKTVSVLEKAYSLGCREKALLIFLGSAHKTLGNLNSSQKYWNELELMEKENS